MQAQVHLQAAGGMPAGPAAFQAAGSRQRIQEVAADNGCHAAPTPEPCDVLKVRTYIPEPKQKHKSRHTDNPPGYKRAVCENRRRGRRDKGKRLHRRCSELCELTFAYNCKAGSMRRSWLRGLVDVTER